MANAGPSVPAFGNSGEIRFNGSPAPSAVGMNGMLRRVKREITDDVDAGQDDFRPSVKMPRYGEAGHFCFLKLLIPNNVVGCIIGKGGDIMLRLKDLTKVKVKMGKVDDVFPSTDDRVCALSGNPDAVLQAVRFIVTKLTVRFNGTNSGQWEPFALTEDFLRDETTVTKVTFVVTDSTAILLISKEGYTLREFNGDDFSMIISQEKYPVGVGEERLIRCRGPFYRVMEMAKTIVHAVLVDPTSASFPNVVYAKENHPCMSLAVPAARDVSSTDGHNRRAASSVTPARMINTNVDGVQLLFSPLHGIKNIVSSDMLEDIRKVLEEKGEDFRTTTQALGAIASLSSKGMLALSYGCPDRRAGSSTVGRFDTVKTEENGNHGGYGSSHPPKRSSSSLSLGLNSRFDSYGAGPSTAFPRGQQQQGPGRVKILVNKNQFGHFNGN